MENLRKNALWKLMCQLSSAVKWLVYKFDFQKVTTFAVTETYTNFMLGYSDRFILEDVE